MRGITKGRSRHPQEAQLDGDQNVVCFGSFFMWTRMQFSRKYCDVMLKLKIYIYCIFRGLSSTRVGFTWHEYRRHG